MRGRAYKSDADRILLNVMVSAAGCWEWQLCRDGNGYSRVQVKKKLLYGHRLAYELLVGPIPEGRELDHLCRNRGCVNPEHLEPVTPRENNHRSPLTNASKTHCPQGHPYSSENTRVTPENRRVCLTCARAAMIRHHARRAA